MKIMNLIKSIPAIFRSTTVPPKKLKYKKLKYRIYHKNVDRSGNPPRFGYFRTEGDYIIEAL